METSWKVVVIGGGYAGALAAARLGRDPSVDVTIVAPERRLLHRVRLYRQLAQRPDARILIPMESLLQPRVSVRDAWVDSIDLDSKIIHTSNGEIAYDDLVVATGSSAVPTRGVSPDGEDTVSVTREALDGLRSRLPKLNADSKSVLVAGGGATAVEIAGTLASDWPGLRVTMISPEEPLSALGDSAMRQAGAQLRRLGVAWKSGRIQARTSAGVRLDSGDEVTTDVVVWATGQTVHVSKLFRDQLASTAGRDGRLPVSPTLQLAGHPNVYVIGDAAAVQCASGLVPMGCKTAMPMAAHAADNILRTRSGKAATEFAYRDPGACISVGSSWALTLTGASAGRAPMGWGGAAAPLVKWLLCWYVLASIRWQARGWLSYSWFQGNPAASDATSTGNPKVTC